MPLHGRLPLEADRVNKTQYLGNDVQKKDIGVKERSHYARADALRGAVALCSTAAAVTHIILLSKPLVRCACERRRRFFVVPYPRV